MNFKISSIFKVCPLCCFSYIDICYSIKLRKEKICRKDVSENAFLNKHIIVSDNANGMAAITAAIKCKGDVIELSKIIKACRVFGVAEDFTFRCDMIEWKVCFNPPQLLSVINDEWEEFSVFIID